MLGAYLQPSGSMLLLDPEDEGLTEEPLEDGFVCPVPADGPALVDVEGPAVAIFTARGAS